MWVQDPVRPWCGGVRPQRKEQGRRLWLCCGVSSLRVGLWSIYTHTYTLECLCTYLLVIFLNSISLLYIHWFPGWVGGKESACKARDKGAAGLIPGSGRSPGGGNGNPLQDSGLENPMDGGAWRAAVHGVTRSRTGLSIYTHFHIHNSICCISVPTHFFFLILCWAWDCLYLGGNPCSKSPPGGVKQKETYRVNGAEVFIWSKQEGTSCSLVAPTGLSDWQAAADVGPRPRAVVVCQGRPVPCKHALQELAMQWVRAEGPTRLLCVPLGSCNLSQCAFFILFRRTHPLQASCSLSTAKQFK